MKLVFLFGPVASGKLTVARELSVLTGFAVFHNHLIVDAVAAVFPFGSEPFVRLREQFWLATLREAARARRSLIFTFAPEESVAPGFPNRVEEMVRTAGGETIFVELTVSAEEQEKRIGNEDRGAFGKLRSTELLRDLSKNFRAAEATMPKAAISIDTEQYEPAAASRIIAERIDPRAFGT